MREPSPHVDWAAGALRLVTEPVDWAERGRPRRSAVSSFGISGTNAHVVLEGAPAEAGVPAAGDGAGAGAGDGAGGVPAVVCWPLSARSGEALAASAVRLRNAVGASPGVPVAGVSRALATTRTVFEHRAVVVGQGREELLAGLEVLAAGGGGGNVVRGGAGGVPRLLSCSPGRGAAAGDGP